MAAGSDRARRIALAVVLASSTALAGPADDAFNKGRELVKQGKHAEACAAFEESQKLDPSYGTLFNIAQCSEKTGKLATALKLYRELVEFDTNNARKVAANDLATKLAPRVPKLQIQIDSKPAGLVVTVDGAPCKPADCSADVPVDLGEHEIVAKAPGHKDRRTRARVSDEARVVVVPIRLEPAPAPVPDPAPTPGPTPAPQPPEEPEEAEEPEEPAAPSSSRKTIALVAGGAGGAALVGGIVVGIMARGKWNDAKAVCNDSLTCADAAATARANELADAAKTRANISTALVAVGALAAGAGVVLWVTRPKESAVMVTPTADDESAGLVVSGKF